MTNFKDLTNYELFKMQRDAYGKRNMALAKEIGVEFRTRLEKKGYYYAPTIGWLDKREHEEAQRRGALNYITNGQGHRELIATPSFDVFMAWLKIKREMEGKRIMAQQMQDEYYERRV